MGTAKTSRTGLAGSTTTYPAGHVMVRTKAKFERFVKRLEAQLGRHDPAAYQGLLGDRKFHKQAEQILQSQAGSSGFMIFAVHDHGRLLALKGGRRQARQYVIGNPLFAAQMTKHDVRAGLYAPLRIFLYADAAGGVRVEYDLPSSQFGQFANPKIDRVAMALDQKLAKLIRGALDVA